MFYVQTQASSQQLSTGDCWLYRRLLPFLLLTSLCFGLLTINIYKPSDFMNVVSSAFTFLLTKCLHLQIYSLLHAQNSPSLMSEYNQSVIQLILFLFIGLLSLLFEYDNFLRGIGVDIGLDILDHLYMKWAKIELQEWGGGSDCEMTLSLRQDCSNNVQLFSVQIFIQLYLIYIVECNCMEMTVYQLFS